MLSNMKKINGVAVEILCGDITKITTDVLVVPEFCSGIANTPLTQRLAYCGAQDGLESFAVFAKKMRLMPGSVVVTLGGGNARYLFHPAMNPESKELYLRQLKTAVAIILDKARTFCLPTLAVPDFCLGLAFSLTPAETVSVMLSVLKECPRESVVQEFTIVLDKDGKEYDDAVDVLENEDCFQSAAV